MLRFYDYISKFNLDWHIIKYFLLMLVFFLLQACKNNSENEHLILSSDNTRYFDEKELEWKYLSHRGQNIDSLKKIVTILNQKGTNLRNISQYKNALQTHFEALRLAEEISDTCGIIISLNNIGTDLRRTASYTEASNYHYRALELAKNNYDFSKSKAVAMNGLGNIFLVLKKTEEAKDYFEQSLEIEKKLNSALGQAINYGNLGAVMEQKAIYDKALSYYYKSIEQNFRINSNIGLAICKKSIGNIFIKQGNTKDGLTLLKESVNLLKDSDDFFHKMLMQISLCEAYIKLKQFENAELILNQIFSDSHNLNSFENKHIAYQLLSDLRKNQSNYQAALDAKELSVAYRDSTLIQNNEVRILEMENRYKNKQAIEHIKTLTMQKELLLKTKSTQKWIFILLIASLLFGLGFIYNQYRARNKVNAALKKLNEMKLRFFENISHELRTPLTLIKGPLEHIAQNTTDVKIKSDVELIQRNTDRLLYLVNQILSLSKIDAGKFEIKAIEANLAEELIGMAHAFDYQSYYKNIDYQIDIQPTDNVCYDREIIEIIMTNLLSNAFKYTPHSGKISVSGKKLDDYYTISVINSTENILEKNLDIFLERFYSSAQNVQQGIGIGLALVKELCWLYNAKLSINKLEKQVLEFSIQLPITKSNFKQFVENTSIDSEKPLVFNKITFENNNTSQPLILVVEDTEDMLQYIARIFENEYQIELAKNGKEGWDKAQNLLPDLIISDVMMPEMNGFELCEMVKNNSITHHIPLILLTALSEEEHIVRGLEKSADDYIAKPFSAKILKTKVENLIAIRKALAEKYRQEVLLQPFGLVIKGGHKTFNEVLQNVIEKHISNNDFGVEAFCNIAGMSRTQLHRKLSATTGFSATEFIRIHRLKMAAELLKKPDVSVSDACYASGFNDTSYFSKQFKIAYGLSPMQFKVSNTSP